LIFSSLDNFENPETAWLIKMIIFL